ncbi:MAG: STAS domain-containing protein [Sulfuriferula sp.]|nr:STAS domain-containing protein [Sulfuriferula sp.]
MQQTSNIYSVSGKLVIATAMAQLASAYAALKNGTEVFDFSALEALDSTALALIVSCQREAARLGKQLRCVNMPENLKNLAALYGVENYISTRTL